VCCRVLQCLPSRPNHPRCRAMADSRCVAKRCNALQRDAVCYGVVQCVAVSPLSTLLSPMSCDDRKVCDNALQCVAVRCGVLPCVVMLYSLQLTAAHCSSLQLTATHCNLPQLTATHFNSLQLTATHCNSLQRIETHCNPLQITATHYNRHELISLAHAVTL